MSAAKRARIAFIFAIVLLVISAAATYLAIRRLLQSEAWVIRTHQVQAAVGDVDSAVAIAGRSRVAYQVTGDEDFKRDFLEQLPQIPKKLDALSQLSQGSPKEQEYCAHLQDLTRRRMALFVASVRLRESNPADQAGQSDLTRQGLPLAAEVTTVTEQIRGEEAHLLAGRQEVARRLFIWTGIVLGSAFVLSLWLFSIHYRLLSSELVARQKAEQAARVSEEALRLLTTRLMKLQDEERRKFSRELHDSLGQYLAGAKMNLQGYAKKQAPDERLTEAIELLDQSIAETRTISYLLHPPLLDEIGLSSAVQWYVEGFSKRSGIKVAIDVPSDLGRFSSDMEIAIFRIVQECLTNIHRHSSSPTASVKINRSNNDLEIEIRDAGKGISKARQVELDSTGRAGVGFRGMRERVGQLGGTFQLHSDPRGTTVIARLPVSPGVVSAV
jgi:signal transduction histidine kinase